MNQKKSMHGTTKARGCSHLRLGNFCKLFPKLSTWAEDCKITDQCDAEKIAELLGGPGGIMHDQTSSSPDSDLPAGYTFFSQFIDHDITLDTTSKLHGKSLTNAEVSKLPNVRSASLDLDCVYGFGPDANPFLYDQSQPGRMLTGSKKNPDDVPRNKDGRALIGDPRNDENIFVSQLQYLFLRFHNRRIVGRSFEEAQEDVRFHYQWLVLHDFLKRICNQQIYNFALTKLCAKKYPLCDIRDKCGRICMPVEFSVAAYRFGHSLVRSEYPANADYPVVELFDERFGTLGFGSVPPALTVDWRFLLDVEKCHGYVKSKAFDHFLAQELIQMPDPIVGRLASANDRSLAFRNLLRAYALGLPSGQKVREALKAKGYRFSIRPDLKFAEIPGWKCLPADLQKKLATHTPLFFYLMREAGVLENGMRLGPVGSAILLEVFGSMLVHCETFLSQKKGWTPDPCIWNDPHNPAKKPEDFSLSDIVRYLNG